jgi:type IV fimbrial biogenesis protein FimT
MRNRLDSRMILSRSMPQQAARGFTLVELMITVLIVAILAAVAVPAFNANTPASEANSLLGSMQFARSAAVKQGQNIVVCASSDGATCNGGTAWNTGWIVLAPTSLSCTATGGATGDVVLQAQNKFTNKDTATFTALGGNTANAFCFNKMGFVSVAFTGKVAFNTTPANSARSRCTILSGVGHAQVVNKGASDALQVSCP